MSDSDRFVNQVAAAMEAARVWRTFRDPERTTQAHRQALEEARMDTALHQEEWQTAHVLSVGVMRSMAGRVARIWDRYEMRIVDVGQDADAATQELVSGVYRELDRIRDFNGSIPTKKLAEWWEACARF